MDQPPLVNMLLQCLNVKSSITIVDDLFRNSLPNAGPRHFQDTLPPVEQTEIVPDVKIPRLEDELQLMGIAAQNLLEALVRQASFLVFAVRGQQRPRQVRMPSHAFDLVWKPRLRGYGRVDGRLVQRIAVEA